MRLLKNFYKFRTIGTGIRIEASTKCQLKCPCCIQTYSDRGILGEGYLSYTDFKKFVDEYSGFRNIELSSYGEIFLNLDLEKIIEYAFIKKVRLTALTGVNLNFLPESLAEVLVLKQFRAITVSIDGASQEAYSSYRKGGKFNQVIDNIKKINAYKEKYKSKFPKLFWQFILFEHNKHEFLKAKKLASNLKMGFTVKLNYDSQYSPVNDPGIVKNNTDLIACSRQEYELKTNEIYSLPCYQLWYAPQVNWNGDLLGCCVNRWVNFGNIFRQGLKACLRSRNYINTRKIVLGEKNADNLSPCFFCSTYKKIKKMLSKREVFNYAFFLRII